MNARRVELTLSQGMWEELERVRGDVPRAAWIKRVIRRELEKALGNSWAPTSEDSASTGASVSAPTRAPKAERLTEAQSVMSQVDWAMECQQKLNEAKEGRK